MRLSRNFALPAPASARKSTPFGLTPGSQLRQTQACVLEADPRCFNRKNPAKPVEFDRSQDAVERVTMVIGQPLEVALLPKLAATNVLIPAWFQKTL